MVHMPEFVVPGVVFLVDEYDQVVGVIVVLGPILVVYDLPWCEGSFENLFCDHTVDVLSVLLEVSVRVGAECL